MDNKIEGFAICLFCKEVFIAGYLILSKNHKLICAQNFSKALYCSDKCRNKSRIKITKYFTFKCAYCGKINKLKKTKANLKRKFCSRRKSPDCERYGRKYIQLNKSYITENGKRKLVSKHTIKKGMKKISHQGYVSIWDGDQWQLEHRMIFEKYLDRKLEKGEIIHHRNGKKQDNRIENLQLLTTRTHSSYFETKHSEDIHNLIIENKKLLELLTMAHKELINGVQLLIDRLYEGNELMGEYRKAEILSTLMNYHKDN